MQERLRKLRQAMQEAGVTALLVNKPENRRYLSGFTGSSGFLLLTSADAVLLTDGRYDEQATQQAPDFQVIRHAPNYLDTLQMVLADRGVKELAFEKDVVTYETFEKMHEKLPGVQLQGHTGLVEGLRLYKDASELAALRQAAAIADQAFGQVLGFIRAGRTESEVALELETTMRRLGAEGIAFDTIVASGPRSALPHGVASERVIQAGEFVKLDFGCRAHGYCSDMTRTIVVGEPASRQAEIHALVLAAQQAAVRAVRPGLTGRELDGVARQFISEAGYGDRFIHGLGHGVGLAVHELPRASQESDQVLEESMVVTIEPGVYLPGFGGVRIEDTVVVAAGGCEVLNRSPRELIRV